MTRKRYIRKPRGTRWTSESSALANKVRWDRDRAKREAQKPERIRELADIAAQNLPHAPGDILGTLQWTDARTGRVRRWTIRIGDRRDQITAEQPGGKPTRSHGWHWFLTHLRTYLCRPQP